MKSEGLVGRLSVCDLSGDIPHTSAQSYMHFVQEYQLLHIGGGPPPPLSSSVILVRPSDSTPVGIIIGVRQSLRTTEGWALSVEGLTMVAKEEVITRHWGRRQVLGKYSNNLRRGFLKT